MKITLALDLKHRSAGAIEFIRWLSDDRGQTLSVQAVHAVPEQYTHHFGALFSQAPSDLIHAARIQLERQLKESGAGPWTGEPSICTGDFVESLLERECKASDSQLLVIGRIAPVGEPLIVRLGGVARRLLRRLAQPTAVVPPDLKAKDIGPGPVLVALGCRDNDIEAARWALKFATSIGRRVVFAHVATPPDAWPYAYAETGAVKSVDSYFLDLGRDSATAWIEQQGYAAQELVVDQGTPAARLVAIAQEKQACAIVCGSRRLSLTERVFSTSVGSELAAASTLPVIIVPS